MTYKEFSELPMGSKVTLSQTKDLFSCDTSVTIEDKSCVRGAKTIYAYELKSGDWVNNGTRFLEVIE